ncbi:hypothetical protein P12x_002997 [Tundrisphaera lichenicola]|uniref:hypothetical protein n=1 Tax=Tundrisphaera lichenicola TaxID=2029860 RepID=UPI003EBF264C
MRPSKILQRILGFSCLPLCLAFVGCGDSDLPEIARVTGTVTYKGKPVPNMMVNFMPTAGRPSWGKTDDEGHFEMNYDADNMGVMTGHHKVYFNPAVATIDGGRSKQSKQALASGVGLAPEDMQVILTKYGKEDSTKYEVDVTKDPTVLEIKLD